MPQSLSQKIEDGTCIDQANFTAIVMYRAQEETVGEKASSILIHLYLFHRSHLLPRRITLLSLRFLCPSLLSINFNHQSARLLVLCLEFNRLSCLMVTLRVLRT